MFDTFETLNVKADADYEVQDLKRCANCRYRTTFTLYPRAACRKFSDKLPSGTNVYIDDDGICKYYERRIGGND